MKRTPTLSQRARSVSVLLTAALFLYIPARAATPTAAFLKVNPSARAAALGAGGSAVVDDASALFLNPAGLAVSDNANLIAGHTDLFLDNRLDVLGYSQLTRFGAIGVSAAYLSRSAMETRDENRSVTGSLSSGDLAAGLSYAARLGARIRAGVTVKEISQRLGSASATGVAADFGAQMVVIPRSLVAGFAVTNLGPGLKLVSERSPLPTAVTAGVGYAIGSVMISADGRAPLHGGAGGLSIGAEYSPFKFMALRSGYLMSMGTPGTAADTSSPLSRFAGFGLGLGLTFSRYTIDFAISPNQELAPTQTFTLSSRF